MPKGARSSGVPPYKSRPIEVLPQRETFLIVCEGEKTEPNYFRAFKIPSKVIEVDGAGADPMTVVDRAIALRAKRKYDQVWCVFDRDSFHPNRFVGAITRARAENISVAYSNEAFELWYLLHFNYVVAGVPRKAYAKMLSGCLGMPYRKNDKRMLTLLAHLQGTAIANARRLLANYSPCKPHKDNPSTTVHLLVEAISDQLR